MQYALVNYELQLCDLGQALFDGYIGRVFGPAIPFLGLLLLLLGVGDVGRQLSHTRSSSGGGSSSNSGWVAFALVNGSACPRRPTQKAD